MENTAILNSMVNEYNARAFAHQYIFGFEHEGSVYFTITSADALPFVVTLDKASRGAGYSLRFKPNRIQKARLLGNARILCSALFFNEAVNACKYNAGEVFEKLVTEFFGQAWEKDNIPFTEAGDIEVDGIAYQIKYNKATFCNEKQLARLRAA